MRGPPSSPRPSHRAPMWKGRTWPIVNTSHAHASHVGTSLWTHTLTCTHTPQTANQVTTGRVLESPNEEVSERAGTIIFLFSAPPPHATCIAVDRRPLTEATPPLAT